MKKLELPARSKSGPHLSDEDISLIRELGIKELQKQAERIVEDKLKVQPDNDGKQTPEAGNPVYKAMHACGAASRKQLTRNHRIPAGADMSSRNMEAVVNLLMRWLVREYNFYKRQRDRQKKLAEFS